MHRMAKRVPAASASCPTGRSKSSRSTYDSPERYGTGNPPPRDRGDRAPRGHGQLLHRIRRLAHTCEVRARSDVQVQAGDGQAVMIVRDAGSRRAVVVPDAVLRLIAAGVRLAAVAVAEARVNTQRDRTARRPRPIDRSCRASHNSREPQRHDQVERFAIEDVGRVYSSAAGHPPRHIPLAQPRCTSPA